jgi:hypothetical protein
MMNDWFSPPKKPATISGGIVRLGAVFLFVFVFLYLSVQHTVPTKVVFVITAAVLAPGVLLSIVYQIRLSRALSRKRRSGFGI